MKPKRNDPFPCGSHKKFKKCCIDKPGKLEDIYNQQTKWLDDELTERSPAEVAYDDVLLASLRDNLSIEDSIKAANTQYPNEALQYNSDSIDDIEAHYTFLLKHIELKSKFDKM